MPTTKLLKTPPLPMSPKDTTIVGLIILEASGSIKDNVITGLSKCKSGYAWTYHTGG